MGKLEKQRLPVQQRQQNEIVSRNFFCERCTMVLSRISIRFNFKCFLVLVLSFAVFLPVVFWILPNLSKQSGFEAPENIKLASNIQAYFRLEKPVSDLVPLTSRLEYDIIGEIAVPYTKVAIISLSGAGATNKTNVTFGFLPDPIDSSIPPVALSLLKSSLLDLYSQEINLTLTASIFGRPSSFEILKFPGGITVIPNPKPFSPFWDPTEVLFKFTLNNSIDEIKENFVKLEGQLKLALHLSPNESVFLQVTNSNGSTKDPPVTVEASVVSDLGALPLQRLQQLAHIVMGSIPARNLGLDNSLFGQVKQISLASFLNHRFHAASPTPSPAPAPNGLRLPLQAVSPAPAPFPICYCSLPASKCNRFLLSDTCQHCGPTCGNKPTSFLPNTANPPYPSVPISSPPSSRSEIPASTASSPLALPATPDLFSHVPANPPHLTPKLNESPGISPLPTVSYGSSVGQDKGNVKGFS